MNKPDDVRRYLERFVRVKQVASNRRQTPFSPLSSPATCAKSPKSRFKRCTEVLRAVCSRKASREQSSSDTLCALRRMLISLVFFRSLRKEPVLQIFRAIFSRTNPTCLNLQFSSYYFAQKSDAVRMYCEWFLRGKKAATNPSKTPLDRFVSWRLS